MTLARAAASSSVTAAAAVVVDLARRLSIEHPNVTFDVVDLLHLTGRQC